MPFIEGVPTVTVQLDKPRELGFTMGAMERVRLAGAEEVATDNVGSLLAVPIYVWACLDAQSRAELTLDQVKEMVHPGNVVALDRAIKQLFGASSPEASADADPTTAGPKLATG